MRARLRARLKRMLSLAVHYAMPLTVVGLLTTLIGNFSVHPPAPPRYPDDLCRIFQERPDWYDQAAASRQRWGTPISTQMAFVRQESAFQSHVRPPRTRLWDLIPWSRPSSAFGYAQAQDPAWADYMGSVDHPLAQRSVMEDALDFIGWYNRGSHERLGIALSDSEQLYLAYHEGRTGYLRHSYRHKPEVRALARKVARQASRYRLQLQQCERALRCRHWYQFGPFCPAD